MARKTVRPRRVRARGHRQIASKRARSRPAPQALRRAQPKASPRKPRVPPAWSEAEIEEAFRRFAAANPEPVGELQYVTPFTLLVAVVLSAQATDASVNKATPALFAVADTPAKMVALGEERVSQYIKTIGLYRTKAKNLVALSRQLIAQHGGEVPRTREALEARVPVPYKRHAHHWLILHGCYICTARAPHCDRCLIADLCRWPDKNVGA